MKRWHILALGGLLGVASLWLVPFEVLAPEAHLTAATRLLALIQPALLTVLAILAGETLGQKVGLQAPLTDALLGSGSASACVRRIAAPAILAGVASALIVITYGAVAFPELTRASPEGARLVAFQMPLLTKLLYGGIVEELLTRWGLLSLFAWLGWRFTGRPQVASAGVYVMAIVASAVLFAAGHLPLLFIISPDPKAWLIAAVLLGNVVPGLLFGWLFWRRGLEAAIVAHMLAHLGSTLIM